VQRHEEEVAATDVGVQGHEEEEVTGIDAGVQNHKEIQADDETIEAYAFQWRGTQIGHFVLPPSAPAQLEARVLIILVGVLTFGHLCSYLFPYFTVHCI
jgi:hypothetical protein